MPELDDSSNGESAEDERKHTHRRLSEHQEPALIEAVRSRSCPGQKQKQRSELQAYDNAQSRRIMMSKLRQDKPVLRDALHPGADVGNQGAGCPQAEVETSQGAEGACCRVFSWMFGRVAPMKLAEVTRRKEADK